MHSLKPITLDLKPAVDRLFEIENSRSADFCFGNVYMWDKRFKQSVTLCGDRLVTAEELRTELCGEYTGKRVLLVGDGTFVAKGVFDRATDNTFTYEAVFGGVIYQDAFSVASAALDHADAWCDENGIPKAGEYGGKTLSPTYLRASQAERERNEKCGG